MNPEITSKRLRELMESGGLNASRLATKTKGDRATIGRILRGDTIARESTLAPIAKFFKVSIEYLQGIDNTFEKEGSNSQLSFEETLKNNLSEKDRTELTPKEIEIFFKVLYLHREEIEEMELFKTFENAIRIDEREKAVKEILIDKIKEFKTKKD